ncbi:hypothetical protein L596_021920 [Steinernema carpocapsae]|uniref:Uncharacterized protein n=3 Tax=Steinernema carpocapsae TaxID=34508 RepID=A0A4V6A036_STECR|nr:hypothetical protein L596_021920 [Steinernema carpocapsae]
MAPIASFELLKECLFLKNVGLSFKASLFVLFPPDPAHPSSTRLRPWRQASISKQEAQRCRPAPLEACDSRLTLTASCLLRFVFARFRLSQCQSRKPRPFEESSLANTHACFVSQTSPIMNARAGQLLISRVQIPQASDLLHTVATKTISQNERLRILNERANLLYKEKSQKFLRIQISYFVAQLLNKFKLF